MAKRKARLEDDVDRLYTLDPSEFIKARDELAKRLKSEGRTEEAAEVGALRRPTVAAWAANQVARQHPKEIGELLAAGDDLRQAQRKALSGVKGGGFREAMQRRRKAVDVLAERTESLLRDAGKGSVGTIEALLPTFEAASVDPDAGELLKAGRLDRELAAPSGFGGVTGLEVVAAPRERPKARSARTEEEKAAQAKQEAARKEVRELERQAAEARRAAIRTRDAATRAMEKAIRLAEEAAEAKAAARDVLAEAKAAEAEAKKADAAATKAARVKD
jgi:hypothetical protein